MLRSLRIFAVWMIVAAIGWSLWPAPTLRHPPGLRAPAEPFQRPIPPHVVATRDDCTITAVASYAIGARVLRTKRYFAQREDLVPYDVALGWGAMSDQAVLDGLKISQSNRFFFYSWHGAPPIAPAEMSTHAANVHVISADEKVAAEVRRLRAGQWVEMHGYLVNVSGPNGFRWNTSLVRTDRGNGACEIFYVERIRASDSLSLRPAAAVVTQVRQ